MHYYPHHIGDFIKATSRLTDSQSMAYLRLLWLYYEQEQPLTIDCDLLAFQIGSDPATVELVLKSFFKFDGQVWRQTRCDDVIASYQKQSTGGKLGAKKRWDNQKNKGNDGVAIAPLLPDPMGEVIATNNQKPITNNQVIKTIAMPDGIDLGIWADFLKVRKAKKAPLTETALKGIAREAAKSGISLNDALKVCCERSWISYKAEWADSWNSKQQKQEQTMDKMQNFWAQIEGHK